MCVCVCVCVCNELGALSITRIVVEDGIFANKKVMNPNAMDSLWSIFDSLAKARHSFLEKVNSEFNQTLLR